MGSRLLPALAGLLLAACGALPEGRDEGARILTMGDSILAWNRDDDGSISDVVEKRLGMPVLDASVPGARMQQGGVRGAVGFSIPGQYRAGEWDAVILNGGANDLRGTCGCNGCDAVLDRLVRRDYPALLDRLGNTDVVIVGYYGPIRGGGGSFAGCSDELAELGRRLAVLAAGRPRVTFVPVRAAINGNPVYYASDKVHPSPAGSQVIGALVARALVASSAVAR